MIKSGYAGIIGKPNAGKSTLLNAILGQKLSVVSSKPQTTRKDILGILSEQDYQIIFRDTPGIIDPKYLLQNKMMEYVKDAVLDVDVLLIIFDAANIEEGIGILQDSRLPEVLINIKTPKIAIINKIDLVTADKCKKLAEDLEEAKLFQTIHTISALKELNITSLVDLLLNFIPEHPKYYPDDYVSNENERFFVSEIIREKILELYHEEIPYSCEIVIDDFIEKEGRKDHIYAMIYVERVSQKGIVIGKGGEAIKKLGQKAREAVEVFLERPVFLELRVKVRENWRNDERMLKHFGYVREEDTD